MSAPIEFGELPPDPRGGPKWDGVIAQLKARPGEWAKIETKQTRPAAGNGAANIRRGMGRWVPIGAFEAAARGCDVWARYVGDES